MRLRKTMLGTVVGLLSGGILTIIACGSDGGGGGSPSRDGSTSNPNQGTSTSSGGTSTSSSGGPLTLSATGPEALDWVNRFCGLLSPCCPRYGYGADEAKCRRAYSNEPANYFYDPVQGEACIKGMTDGIAADPEWCRGPDTPASCTDVFKSPTAGPAGSTCNTKSDCQSSPEGNTTCLFESSGSICQLTARGKPGEVCQESDNAHVNSLPDPPLARLVSCRSDDHLYCDSTTHVCTAQKDVGGSCVFNEDCLTGQWCNAHTCEVRHVAGEVCGANPATCATGFWCDSGTLKCAAVLDDGMPCTNPVSCKHFCKDGTCKDVPVANIVYLLVCDHD